MERLITTNQWLGLGKGDNDFGTVILDLDEWEENCTGTFYAFEEDVNLPSVYGQLTLNCDSLVQTVSVDLFPFCPLKGVAVSPDKFEEFWPDAYISKSAEIELKFSEEELMINWSSDAGHKGTVNLYPFSDVTNLQTELVVEKIQWGDFKSIVEEFPYNDFVFRGQSDPWSLTTSFHRTNRKDLIGYINNDIPNMYRMLHPYIGSEFNHENSVHNAAMYHLLQHHGYPTPMLDWTNSPYIAAFFAFHSVARHKDSDEYVRIYVFNRKSWHSTLPVKESLTFVPPHISFLDVLPIKNNRSFPQQGVSMFTNCFGIENFIQYIESVTEQTFLKAYDIPKSSKNVIMEDLCRMGITASVLFPGIDGVCASLRRRNFA